MPRPVRAMAARLSAIVHSTEDPRKVARAMCNLAPSGLPRPKSQGRKMSGHHGNEIIVLRTESHSPGVADKFLASVWGRLTPVDRAQILSNAGLYVSDAGGLYLRVDKQRAFEGEVLLAQAEPIKIEITFDLRGVTRGQARNLVTVALEDLAR